MHQKPILLATSLILTITACCLPLTLTTTYAFEKQHSFFTNDTDDDNFEYFENTEFETGDDFENTEGFEGSGFESAPPDNLNNNHSTSASALQPRSIENIAIFISFTDDDGFTAAEIDGYKEMYKKAKAFYEESSYGQSTLNTTLLGDPANNIYFYKNDKPHTYYLPYGTDAPDGYKTDIEKYDRIYKLYTAAMDFMRPYLPTGKSFDADNDGAIDCVTLITNTTPHFNTIFYPVKSNLTLFGGDYFLNGAKVTTFNVLSHLRRDENVLIHEMYHSFGAPDYYPKNLSQNKDQRHLPVDLWDPGAGISKQPIQHMTLYSKMKYLKWVDEIPEITKSGTYHLRPASLYPDGLKIGIPGSAVQNFYMEFRDASSAKSPYYFESALPDSGLIIMRAAENLNGNYRPTLDELYVLRDKNHQDVNSYATRKKGQSAGRGHTIETGFPLLYYATDPANAKSSDAALASLDTVKIDVTDAVYAEDNAGEPTLTFKVSFAHDVKIKSEDNAKGSVQVTSTDPSYNKDSKTLWGEVITADATPQTGYVFSRWEAKGYHLPSGDERKQTLHIIMPDNDISLTAVFEEDPSFGPKENSPGIIEQN